MTELRRVSNEWLRELFRSKIYSTALNLGCGTDADLEGGYYSDYFTSNILIKADMHPKSDDTIAVLAEELPFEDNTFDLIFMNWVFYKTDMEKCLDELVRVLKGTGKVLISCGLPDQKRLTDIMSKVRSVFHAEQCFQLIYPAKGVVRYAEIIYGGIL